MKKRDLYSFMRGLKLAKFKHPRVTYAVNKNKRLIQEVMEDMEKAIEQTAKLKEFGKEREELAKKHSLKDESGSPKMRKVPGEEVGDIQMVYDIEGQDDPKGPYRVALKKLEKKYETEIKEHEDKVEKFNKEFLDDETDYQPFRLGLKLLETHEECPQPVMDLIFWMVDETK
jgi:hypothetical protein